MAWWQNIPQSLDPIAFSIGFFSLHWYAVFFLGGSVIAFLFLFCCGVKEEERRFLPDLFFSVLIGALIGGRLGYALWYYPEYFFSEPIALISPYDFTTGEWVGLSGMSYFGGVFGVAIAVFLFARKRGLSILRLTDALSLSSPIALFFGRLGNFMNNELPGRVTEKAWGMFFQTPGTLRHPSALYEAFLEGIVLFLLLVLVRRFSSREGILSASYLLGYGLVRFVAEWFREPDPQLGYYFDILTLGQIFSVVFMLFGALFFVWLRGRKYDTLKSV